MPKSRAQARGRSKPASPRRVIENQLNDIGIFFCEIQGRMIRLNDDFICSSRLKW